MKTALMALAAAGCLLLANQAFAGAQFDQPQSQLSLRATPPSPIPASPVLLADHCYRPSYGYSRSPSYYRGPSYHHGHYGSPYRSYDRYDAYRYGGHGYPYGYSRGGIGYSGRNFSIYYGF